VRRLDQELVKRGLATSRTDAQELINLGKVSVNGIVMRKSTTQVNENASIIVKSVVDKFVSRGALKLKSALDQFQININGLICLDAGASTGGFTELLLHHGASKVYAVDVGYGQLAWKLQTDNRVVVMDRTNIKDISIDDLADPIDLITADLSFISLKSVLPYLVKVIKPEGEMILMVKPQFEVGKENIGRGVVRSAELRLQAVLGVITVANEYGWGVVGAVESKVHGPSGNREFFLHLRQNSAELTPEQIAALITEEK
jgi:23S rRNA (cytidine1920-2'-O)/16S rRNA (cytidine1409-2'-O)-methyltransferase